MTILKAGSMLCVLLTLWSLSAFPCELLLSRSRYQVSAENYELNNDATVQLRRQGLSQDHLNKLLKSNIPIIVEDEFWLVIFEHDSTSEEIGYLVSGRVEAGHYDVELVDRATPGEEKDYFRAVADLHGLRTKVFALRNGLFRCQQLVFGASTQVKLWLKHHLDPSDVVQLLDQPHRSQAKDGRDRYTFFGHNLAGRTLRVVIAVEPDCRHKLITAYEVAKTANRAPVRP